MADDEEKKEQKSDEKQQSEQKSETGGEKPASFGLFTWLIIAGVVVAGLVGGFALAQLLAAPGSAAPDKAQGEQAAEGKTFTELYAQTPENEKCWTYDLDPAFGNLDEPGVSRFLKVSLSLELSPKMDREKGIVFLNEKKPILKDYVTTYISGLTLERVRGSANVNRIKKEMRDGFNELLFPESNPLIVRVNLQEFAIN